MSRSDGGTLPSSRKAFPMAGERLGKARPSGTPSESVERKIRILLELIRNKFVTVSRLQDEYGTAERSLLRDFQEMRAIGERAGFEISDHVENDQIRLISFDRRPTALDKSGKALQTLIHDAAQAFGAPVEQQLETIAGEETSERRFLRFLITKLREGTRVADVFNALHGAWAANARVKFLYSGRERTVEPGVVLLRSGRYYLVARDPKTREWRYFALDKIAGTITRAGSFSPQPVPQSYTSGNVIGFMKGNGEHRVSVWLSASIAASAASREWQPEQEVHMHDDGSATITFTVSEIDEVVRWALGFGAEARVCAPEHAVALAGETIARIAGSYE